MALRFSGTGASGSTFFFRCFLAGGGAALLVAGFWRTGGASLAGYEKGWGSKAEIEGPAETAAGFSFLTRGFLAVGFGLAWKSKSMV